LQGGGEEGGRSQGFRSGLAGYRESASSTETITSRKKGNLIGPKTAQKTTIKETRIVGHLVRKKEKNRKANKIMSVLKKSVWNSYGGGQESQAR